MSFYLNVLQGMDAARATSGNCPAGLDEAWFQLVHVEIEARAAAGIGGIMDAQAAVLRHDHAGVVAGLQVSSLTQTSDINASLHAVRACLCHAMRLQLCG